MFTLSDMAPGQSESHTVVVQNDSPESRPIAIRGVKTSETGSIASVMTIAIARDGTDVYGGTLGTKTLEQFFTETTLPESIALATLAPAESESFIITVTFDHTAGNSYQNQQLSINFIMGLAVDIPLACSSIKFNGSSIYGTAGNDRLRGTNKNDLIIALEGNDTVDAGNGDDCIVDLSGNGTLDGGNGNDSIVSGEGNTSIDGGNGKDTIMAGGDNDKITGGNDEDTLRGENGEDNIDGENGNDLIFGGEGNDTIVGGLGNDNLNGEHGTDKTDGDLGKDTCVAETKKSCEL